MAPRAAADHHQVVLLVAHLARCPSQGPAQGKFAHLAAGQPDGQGRRAQPWHTGSARSEEHTSELQSLMRISYAVFCLKKKTHIPTPTLITHDTANRTTTLTT